MQIEDVPRPLTTEENEVFLRLLTAALPAMAELSGLRNCMANACYASHNHVDEMKKVSVWAHNLAGYLLDDWRQVQFIEQFPVTATRTKKKRVRRVRR